MFNQQDAPTEATIQYAAKLLKEGKIVALPTETVYGLGACARHPKAIQKIYAIKKRPASNPLIIHLSEFSAIEHYAIQIPKIAYKLAETFWPGPLTLVLNKHPSVLDLVTGGQNSVALRIPNHPIALKLIETLGEGIAAPSANLSGCISPSKAEHVQKTIGNKVDYILDGGPCSVGIESTIVSLLEEKPLILREGQILAEDIAHCLGVKSIASQVHYRKLYPVKNSHSATNEPITPGLSLKHYAPNKDLFLLESFEFATQVQHYIDLKKACSLLSFKKTKEKYAASLNAHLYIQHWIALDENPEIYAQSLYDVLHQLDEDKSECILVEAPPKISTWAAILDRLQRASYK